ncbi:hypothetical protein [Gelidibacter pelagius]|uniref:Uncharacterized protein n=1 Tax=Gelidibacter pelagius TaxID=2819985 RepID=A0ABS3SWE7_9FLAO|nr:hypothetical protein [Gelidibacter pelagius]MBO3100039.1 hypothetical protein [Gelidibacter pelagius]
MKISLLAIILNLFLLSCGDNKKTVDTNSTSTSQEETVPKFQNKGHELVYTMAHKVGDYNQLLAKKDVVYTYTYQTPDGKKDVVTEKYLFNGELSYGAYNIHERTFPQLEGLVEQGYDGHEFWLKHNEDVLSDDALLKGVKFNRPTNFYWFTMMPKLLDEGLKYEYLDERLVNNIAYDIVNVTFDDSEKEATDTYQLFINKNTSIVDQFLFTVADFNVMEQPYLMVLEYENVDGMLLPSKRKYKKSTWDAEVLDGPWIEVTWSSITFDNGLTKDDFKK